MKYSLFVLGWLAFACQAQFVYQAKPQINGSFQVKTDDLCRVANNTLTYLNLFSEDTFAVHKGELTADTLSLNKVKETLAFTCKLSLETLDKNFLINHFDFYQWLPDKATANQLANESDNKVKKRLLENIPEDQIFLTKYYTKLLDASEIKTDKYNQALYQLPFDEQRLTAEQAEFQKEVLTRFQYTRQQVLSGILHSENLAKPLVWVTEEALHDVLLQGTGVVDVNGKQRYFNVHRNNGIAYDYTIGKRDQARYWYFSEVPSILGYGQTIESKIAIKPDVTFAGNVKQLGLGKLFLINYQVAGKPVNQMGILADQGGAFDNNLFQLDFLKGSYRGWKDYHHANKHLPDYVNAWLLVLKDN